MSRQSEPALETPADQAAAERAMSRRIPPGANGRSSHFPTGCRSRRFKVLHGRNIESRSPRMNVTLTPAGA